MQNDQSHLGNNTEYPENDAEKYEQKAKIDVSPSLTFGQDDHDDKINPLNKQKDQQHLYEMSEEFDLGKNEKTEEGKKREHPKSYVEGCDMGWC
ncbi:DUF2553 family protein [Evansella sp. AB-P1]|uniref:DUF2553 family protein n=1 Tax=Evansella sp. AB-P1 TaxID=3037653 RepID=UPI00241C5DE3|nr:DUF2553 family protein [Evansella sp. AB-P1]MDG5788930.1 DUF2553 family protein [Evansella sp. AB-P1]